MNIADAVAQACIDVFMSLPQGGGKPHPRSNGRLEWTILSGVVLQLDTYELVPVALATGVKCTPYNKLSKYGDIVHDCHAEVLARRCFRIWLLERLIKEVSSDAPILDGLPRIYEPIAWAQQKPIRWRLRSHMFVHWYISTWPCGEASTALLFARNTSQDGHAPSTLPTSKAQPLVRGRNHFYMSLDHCILRTKPGRPDAPPSISMSCTDKIMLWNQVGVQGALLSKWIEPVYATSWCIGVEPDSLYGLPMSECTRLCQWAIYERIPSGKASHGEVHASSVSFPYSREVIERQVLDTHEVTRDSPRWEDVEPVPCAASIIWSRGLRMENIVNGARMGSSTKRKGDAPLPKSSWSIVSQRAWDAKVQEAENVLSGLPGYTSFTYYEKKHPSCVRSDMPWTLWDEKLLTYQQQKQALRGVPDEHAVFQFLQNNSANGSNGTLDTPAANSIRSDSHGASLMAWLVTPRACTDFL